MRFPFVVWLLTRSAVFIVAAKASRHGIAALGNWDGAWYGTIATRGYEFASDGKLHNVAFFPFFPMLSSLLMRTGVTWPYAGIIVNNVAFLLAVIVLYAYASRRFSERVARWAVVAICVSPLSLFGSAAYSEGVFICCVAIALWAYDRERYFVAALATACASAARPFGVALAVALIAAALIERRGAVTVLKLTAGFLGIAFFALFCSLRFHDPLAFVHAQLAWRQGAGFDATAWLGLLRGAAGGRVHDWLSLFLIVVVFFSVTLFGRRLGALNVAFVVASFALFVFAGTPLSADRNLYTVLPLSVTLALWFERAPAAGYALSALGIIGLVLDTAAFVRFEWVA